MEFRPRISFATKPYQSSNTSTEQCRLGVGTPIRFAPLCAKCCRSRRANQSPFFSFVDGHPGLLIVPNCTSAGQRPHVDAHGSKQRRADRRGTFDKNLAVCQSLGALRPKQRLVAAKMPLARRVAPPCWRIGRQPIQSRRRPPVPIASIASLDGYREAWTAAVNLVAR